MAHVFRAFRMRLMTGGAQDADADGDNDSDDEDQPPPRRAASRKPSRKPSSFLPAFPASTARAATPSTSGARSPSPTASPAKTSSSGPSTVEGFARAMGRLVTRSMTRKSTKKAGDAEDSEPATPVGKSSSVAPKTPVSSGSAALSQLATPDLDELPSPRPSQVPARPPSYRSGAEKSAEERRFLDKVGSQVVKMQQEFQQRLSVANSQEVLWFREALVHECFVSMTDGFFEKAQKDTQEALGKAREAARQSREMQASYLREITALRDQIRKLPPGTHQIVDVTQCEPMKYLGEEMRDLVHACVQERIRQVLSQAETGEGELLVAVRGWLAEERQRYQARGQELEQLTKDLNTKNKELQRDLRATSAELETVKVDFTVCEAQRDQLQRQLEEAKTEVSSLRNSGESAMREARNAQRLAQQAMRQLSEAQAVLAEKERKELELKSEKKWDELQKDLAQLLLDGGGCQEVSATQRLPDGPAQLLEQALVLQQQLQSKPRAALDLLQILSKLAVCLDTRALGITAASDGHAQEVLAERLRTARQETAVLMEFCAKIVTSLHDALQATTTTGADRIKLSLTSSVLQEALGAVRDFMSQFLQAGQASYAAVEDAISAGPPVRQEASLVGRGSVDPTGAGGGGGGPSRTPRPPSVGPRGAEECPRSSSPAPRPAVRPPVKAKPKAFSKNSPVSLDHIPYVEQPQPTPQSQPTSQRPSSVVGNVFDDPFKGPDLVMSPTAAKLPMAKAKMGFESAALRRSGTMQPPEVPRSESTKAMDLAIGSPLSLTSAASSSTKAQEVHRPQTTRQSSFILPMVGPKPAASRPSAPGGGAFVIPKRNAMG